MKELLFRTHDSTELLPVLNNLNHEFSVDSHAETLVVLAVTKYSSTMDMVEPVELFSGTPQNVGTIIISGPPAGGKSTQCKMLLKRYGLTHISAGDLLRARQKLIPVLSKYMENGLLVPDDLVCSIVKERLAEQDCRDRGVLLDGFPRTRKQAEALEELGVQIEKVIILDVPDEIVISRVSGRRIDPVSGEVYHIENNPPTKPEVAERLITRDDDTREKMVQRLRAYHKNITAIKSFYTSKKICSVTADLNPAAVFDQIRNYLEGDMYWGCLINRMVTIRSYETSFETGGSLDMITISRYFDHMVWLMQTRGALADIPVNDVHFVVRAHASELLRPLIPGCVLSLRIWIEHVGTTSVTLGFSARATQTSLREAQRFTGRFVNGEKYASEISSMLAKGEEELEVEVARGSTTLVAVKALTRKTVTVPFRNHYKRLVRHGGEFSRQKKRTLRSGNRLIFDRKSLEIGNTKCNSFEMSWLIQPKDIGVDGTLSAATCVSYLETVRFAAEANCAYQSDSREEKRAKVEASIVSRTNKTRDYTSNYKPHLLRIETVSFAHVGDLVRMITWALPEPKGVFRKAVDKGSQCIGFELYNVSSGNDLILRGCQLVDIRNTEAPVVRASL